MIECIPNFSEGRRREVIDALAAAITSVPGALLLDTHIDADHHRCVHTFAGAADAVAEAAFRVIAEAARLIDLAVHRGAHPRIGAADVVPFVPLAGATLAECVELARAVGERVGTELELPVYLYGAAATRPERRNLPDVRRGEYEGLLATIAHDPERVPDFGPARVGPAGAVVIGAREPLIAYNVYLDTDDVRVAQAVAKAIRGSSGGLRDLRALGLLVNGRAQVSMNIVNHRTTPLHRVLALIAHEAALYGAAIAESELVGLMPQEALLDVARYHLRLPSISAAQVLEARIALAQAAQAQTDA